MIGSGPAGLTIASRLASRGIDVIVVETGGLLLDPEAQSLSDVVGVGGCRLGGRAERIRSIGGNSTAWSIKLADQRLGVRYLPLDSIDFVARAEVAGSGWPLAAEDLDSAYRAAAKICAIGPIGFDPAAWTGPTAPAWKLDPEVVDSKIFRFGPRTAFSTDLVAEIEQSPNARLVCGATAVELGAADASAPVSHALCRRLDGSELRIQADDFVVASGGIGNAHLLLASNSTRPAGLGNGSDLVGRFLQDHVLVDGGTLEPSGADVWNGSSFYDLRLIRGQNALGHLALARSALERHDVSGLSAVFFPRLVPRRTAGVASSKALAGRIRTRTVDRDVSGEIQRAVRGADGVAIAGYRKVRHGQSMLHGFGRGGWSELTGLEHKYAGFEIVHQSEQRPDRSKRITLTRDRDRVGMPIVRVAWRWDAEDARLAGRGRRLLADELERAGIGVVRLPDDDDLPALSQTTGTAHHCGTTRMSSSPSTGVVDSDSRLHDVDNVFVAGSSVFPTAGYANPTLAIVALGVRLADHLIDRDAKRSASVA